MAPVDPSIHEIPSDHEIDEILRASQNGGSPSSADAAQRLVQEPVQQSRNQNATGNNDELGVEEEIKVERKRRPIPKLDVSRMVSAAGVPRLQKISKERLKFKGKGHEYGDIARMLNMYQLWLDDLYPRAKFADGLAMIEKLGHSKQMARIRKEWIEDGKPRHSTDHQDDDYDEHVPDMSVNQGSENMQGVESGNAPQIPQEEKNSHESPSGVTGDMAQAPGDDPDEDDLDAWLAESEALEQSLTSARPPPRPTIAEADDLFADEMEVMAEMEAMEAIL